MFSFPLIKGDPATVLLDKNNIVLTRSFAHKVYGSEDILGKEIVINGKHRLIVTGVMEDLPYNTHLGLQKDLSVSIYWQIFGKCHGYWKKTVIVLSDYIS